MAIAACGKDAPDRAPAEASADQRAHARARTMERQGRACDSGDGAARDLAACREACELGHSNSCGWLGDAYALGLGVTRDGERAATRYRQACKGGSGLGCEGLARAADGSARERWFREARIVYRVHCEQERHAASCSRLAVLYRDGLGGAAAADLALSYRQRACALGRENDC